MVRRAVVRCLYGLGLLGFGSLSLCPPASADPTSLADPARPSESDASFRELLVDVTAEVGLDFVHWNGMTGQRDINEVLGGGGVLFDFDRDGDLDLYAVQGHLLAAADEKPRPEPLFPPPPGALLDRLYRNDLIRGKLGFVDVTKSSLIQARGYGMGAVAADFDNDGWPDLYVLNHGADQLWRNRGDGTFEDVTAKSGLVEEGWSTTATFFDFDADGWLDLFVGSYLEYRLGDHKTCVAPSGLADYCGPASFAPAADHLWHNRGDGTFEDVTVKAGLAGVRASALGSVTLDIDLDGRLDLFVANDGMANHLWHKVDPQPGASVRFEETALLAGCAVNADGAAEASMGVDSGDVDGDGDEDLFMTHLDQETNTLYLNDGQGFFEDVSDASGVALESFAFTGFGTRLLDLDNDGQLDVVVVNGSIKTLGALARAGDPFPLHQHDQLWRGLGGGRFREVGGSISALAHSAVSRGLAAGDLDNDGDVDLVIFDNNAPARVLRNRGVAENHWIGLEVWDRTHQRPALGARVGVFVAGQPTRWRRVRVDGSYASGQDPRLVVGLGAAREVERVRVEWPGRGAGTEGWAEEWSGLAPGRYHRLEPGTGRKLEARNLEPGKPEKQRP